MFEKILLAIEFLLPLPIKFSFLNILKHKGIAFGFITKRIRDETGGFYHILTYFSCNETNKVRGSFHSLISSDWYYYGKVPSLTPQTDRTPFRKSCSIVSLQVNISNFHEAP